MIMNKKLVIFDLDGTLADSIESITYCGNDALFKEGLPSFGHEDYKYFVGDGVAVLVQRMLEAAGDKEMARKLLPRKELKVIKRELIASIRNGHINNNLWNTYVEYVESQK